MKTEIRAPKSPQEWKNYYDLRYNVLRKPLNQPLGSEKNDGDKTGKHFALFVNNEIVAIARLDYLNEECNQTRFVAVNPNHQGKGFGKIIMAAVENETRKEGKSKMMLQARDYALDFYLKLSYTVIEKSYKLYDVLQHYKVEKQLI